MSRPVHRATTVAQAHHYVDPMWGGIAPPIQPSTTYTRDESLELRDPDRSYTRGANPTDLPAEALMTELEAGADALLFSSGMAAATSVLATLRPGDRVAIPSDLYYGIRDWLTSFGDRWSIPIDLYEAGSSVSLAAAVHAGSTRWVWVETPANPTWVITDIAHAAEIAHAAGARVVVDNTVPTPLLTQPLTLGADLVVHAATKYLNGHSDVLAGAVVTRRDDEVWKEIRWHRDHGGAVLGPFESWLLLRGLRTLDVRLERACRSAAAIAECLSDHDAVERVLYPGLASHPGHEVASRQMTGGFGGMVSLLVKGDAARAREVTGRTRVFLRATSLGGVESLIEHRASVEGPSSPVAENLLRLSVGIEAAEDLIDDLLRALA